MVDLRLLFQAGRRGAVHRLRVVVAGREAPGGEGRACGQEVGAQRGFEPVNFGNEPELGASNTEINEVVNLLNNALFVKNGFDKAANETRKRSENE